jgi:hypothetical protein
MAPTSFVVKSISSDGLTLKMSTDITAAPTVAGTIVLGAAVTGTAESTGLIKSTAAGNIPVVNGAINLAYN